MNWKEYINLFEQILNGEFTNSPYDNEDYFHYVQLNEKRQHRWIKKGIINPKLKSQIESIDEEQKWILITEPWCGDASHSNPFIFLLSELNERISLTIQLRDEKDSEIDNYLTNEKKSIPKLIVRNSKGNDLFTWGPRPKIAQDFALQLEKDESLSPQERKAELQKWYNTDKGQALQKEFINLLTES